MLFTDRRINQASGHHSIYQLNSPTTQGALSSCGAAATRAEVREKIADLKAMERVLTDAARRCDVDEAAGRALIEALWRLAP